MYGGIINCSCGQQQYVETVHKSIACIKCDKVHILQLIELKVESLEGDAEDETNI